MHRLATDVPFIACVINSPCTFIYYLDLSDFISESGLLYFRVLTICLLLVYSVSAAGCDCFDLGAYDGLYTFRHQASHYVSDLLSIWLSRLPLWCSCCCGCCCSDCCCCLSPALLPGGGRSIQAKQLVFQSYYHLFSYRFSDSISLRLFWWKDVSCPTPSFIHSRYTVVSQNSVLLYHFQCL